MTRRGLSVGQATVAHHDARTPCAAQQLLRGAREAAADMQVLRCSRVRVVNLLQHRHVPEAAERM